LAPPDSDRTVVGLVRLGEASQTPQRFTSVNARRRDPGAVRTKATLEARNAFRDDLQTLRERSDMAQGIADVALRDQRVRVVGSQRTSFQLECLAVGRQGSGIVPVCVSNHPFSQEDERLPKRIWPDAPQKSAADPDPLARARQLTDSNGLEHQDRRSLDRREVIARLERHPY